MPIPLTTLNKAHIKLAETYGGGDYAHLVKEAPFCTSGAWKAALARCGDTLFTFLMVELSNKEGTDSVMEAICRVTTARDQLDALVSELTSIEGA